MSRYNRVDYHLFDNHQLKHLLSFEMEVVPMDCRGSAPVQREGLQM